METSRWRIPRWFDPAITSILSITDARHVATHYRFIASLVRSLFGIFLTEYLSDYCMIRLNSKFRSVRIGFAWIFLMFPYFMLHVFIWKHKCLCIILLLQVNMTNARVHYLMFSQRTVKVILLCYASEWQLKHCKRVRNGFYLITFDKRICDVISVHINLWGVSVLILMSNCRQSWLVFCACVL